MILFYRFLVWAFSSVCIDVNRGLVDELAILRVYGGWGTKLNHHRLCNVSSKQFYYTEPFAHLNDLLDFKPVVNYTNLLYPAPCPAKSEDEILILFGIKSMPKHVGMRNAIRDTWLNPLYWNATRNNGSKIKIHPLFLLGTQNGHSLKEEAAKHRDVLQYDFIESHYNLTVKDHNFFDYILNDCPQVDFVFKGDDDILLVPENLAKHLELIDHTQNQSELVGCMHQNEMVNRNIKSKYYMPRELVKEERYPPYFSGASYLMTANVALKLASAKKHLPITPLDDTYIGELLKKVNMTDKMVSSTSLCTGVHVVPQNAGGWSMALDFDDPCFLAGLTMYHRFDDGAIMKNSFMNMRQTNLSSICDHRSKEIMDNVQTKWGVQQKSYLLDEWTKYYNNFFNYHNDAFAKISEDSSASNTSAKDANFEY